MSYAGLVMVDARLRIVHADGDVFAHHGYDPGHWRGRPIAEALPPEAQAALGPRWAAAAGGLPQAFDYRSIDGRSMYWVQLTPVRGDDGTVSAVLGVMQDVTSQLRSTVELARARARIHESERLVGVGSWELEIESGAITFSEGTARLLGVAPEIELDLDTFRELVHPDDRQVVSDSIKNCLRDGSGRAEYRVIRTDGVERVCSVAGETVIDQDGALGLRGAILDVTEQRVAEAERIAAVSLFEQGFDAAPIGMLISGVAQGAFMRVNDAMCRLLGRSREALLTMCTPDVTHPDDRANDAESRVAMTEGRTSYYETEKRYLRPDSSEVWATLHVAPVRRPDGSVRAFFAQVVDVTERKQREARQLRDVNDAVWLGRIRDALDHDRLVLYHQPIIDLSTGRTVQQELLLRMRAKDGSIVAPGEFLPVAERYGLISEIDRWVIRQAAALAATGAPTQFNVSGASIGMPDVLREIESAIATTGADPSLLTIEVTETAVMEDIESGRVFAERVTALGCSIALDDFGTGWAGLSYLKHFPTHQLKIDMEFVRDVTRSDADERLVRGIVGLAREIGLTTTGEGIEDEPTLVKLRELGVDRGQGYLFGRPRPLADLTPVDARAGPGAVGVVRAVFDAFAARDERAASELFDPGAVVRTFATNSAARRDAPSLGHTGISTYLADLAQVWDTLTFSPTAFHPTGDSVIVFGTVTSTTGSVAQITDVLWVWRLHHDLVTSVEVFTDPPTGSDG
jgi:PAS domain S-box-containing protein